MRNSGFSLIEIVFILLIISVLLTMSITVSSKFAARRSIDDITYKISSSLNTAKLQASRSGLEFETDLNVVDGVLTINTFRGASNKNSDFSNKLEPTDISCIEENNPLGTVCPTSSLDINIANGYTIVPNNHGFQFNPNGTAGLPRTILIRSIDEGNSNIKKCGSIVVSSLGRIRTAVGNWDGEDCNVIGDIQDNEPET